MDKVFIGLCYGIKVIFSEEILMKYFDYPDRKTDIFQPSENNYFFEASDFTYLCSYEEVEKINMRSDFRNAYVLVLYKRYALIKDGQFFYQNKMFEDGHAARGRYKENGFVIISNVPQKYYIQSWNDYLVSYEIRDDQKYNAALNPVIYQDASEAVEVAIKLSKTNQQTYMVAQWFDECDRH